MQDWAWLGWTRGNHSCGVLAGVVTRLLLGCWAAGCSIAPSAASSMAPVPGRRSPRELLLVTVTSCVQCPG